MPTREPGERRVERALEVLGPRWTATILRALLVNGEMRFNALRSLVDGVTPKLLTTRLKELERRGLVRRRVEHTFPPKTWYAVTEAAKGLDAIFAAMSAWEAP